MTEAEFNQIDTDSLKNLENLMVSQVIEKSRVVYASTGNDPSQFNPDVVSESQFVNVGDKRLAIIYITAYPSKTNHQIAMKAVRIIGFTNRGIETIGCIRNSNHDIPIWTGECGKKIKEIFGVEMIQQ